jgi:hypothetical protein
MAISLSVKYSSKLSFAAVAAGVINRKQSSGAMSRIVTIFKKDLAKTYYRCHFSLNLTLTGKGNSQSQQRVAASLNICRLAFVRKPEVSEQCSVVMFLILAKKNVRF